MNTKTDPCAHWLNLWENVHLATLQDGRYGIIEDGAIATNEDGKIAWLGKRSELPADHRAEHRFDGRGAWLTPGLIDCHTHIVYAGNRNHEFEARLNGASYEDIARQGGGIVSTVLATRAASEDELYAQSAKRVRALLREGVTTLEIKSGYGLDLETEAKMLRVARRLGQNLPVSVRTTFLGAHALPPEYKGQPDAYIAWLCETVLPAIASAGLADAVDAFCENIGFTPTQTERVFQAAKKAGLPVKLHAEQLSDQHGAQLLARYHGLSADHLEYVSDAGIAAMAQSGSVAVLLPGAFYFLRETKLPPVAALQAANVPIAISTDSNPGTSPITSILLTMNLACTLFRLTPEQVLAAVTTHAARALGQGAHCGQLKVGLNADFALWHINRPGDLAFVLGSNPCVGVVQGGVVRRTKSSGRSGPQT